MLLSGCSSTQPLEGRFGRKNGCSNLHLIKFHAVLIFVLGLCLRYQLMVLAEKTGRKATEHSHEPKLVLRVRVTTARVECDVLDPPFASKLAACLVTAPQV